MNLDQLLAILNDDKKRPSRFPVRSIQTDSMITYKELVTALSENCDTIIHLGDYCDSDDIYPRFGRLITDLESKSNECVLILGIDAYLMLAMKKETNPSKHVLFGLPTLIRNSTNLARFYIPLYGCARLWNATVGPIDDRVVDFNYSIDGESDGNSYVNLTVYSKAFLNSFALSSKSIIGMKAWLSEWPNVFNDVDRQYHIFTKLVNGCQSNIDIVSTKVYPTAHDYLFDHVKGCPSDATLGTEGQWASLIQSAETENDIKKIIQKHLNFLDFYSIDILSKWNQPFDDNDRWLVWLWYQINPSNDYISRAVRKASTYQKIPESINMAIFDYPEQIEQFYPLREKALHALNYHCTNDAFYAALDSVSDIETRIHLLTGIDPSEKTYLLNLFALWLKKGIDKTYAIDLIKNKYEDLYLYLKSDADYPTPELDNYFKWYKLYKLKNVFPNDADDMINSINLTSKPKRTPCIESIKEKNAFLLWVDALGAEWFPLLIQHLKKSNLGQIQSATIASAILPTETCYNTNWDEHHLPYEKIEELDKIAHNGVPDEHSYYSCIQRQFEIIRKIAQNVENLLQNYNQVIITGDHGTSRLAARAFHMPDKTMLPPKDCQVKGHGRYICGPNLMNAFNYDQRIETKTVNNLDYAIVMNYRHFQSSGNVTGSSDDDVALPGEIHGGGTPEEVLVPVISIIRRDKIILPVKYKVADHKVYRQGRKASIEITFDTKIESLQIKADNLEGKCCPKPGSSDEWLVTFEGVKLQEYTLLVIADGKLINQRETITIASKGLTENDPFGGF